MDKKYLLFFIFLFSIFIIGCIENTNTPNAKVVIHGAQLDKQTEKSDALLKSAVLSSIIPYMCKVIQHQRKPIS
ncbi:MAG TPA: hypothetical protein EYP22_06670 [Methanosarcinales archaeon]|nr:hypothetical protein [Methanosarcinales archaeon]